MEENFRYMFIKSSDMQIRKTFSSLQTVGIMGVLVLLGFLMAFAFSWRIENTPMENLWSIGFLEPQDRDSLAFFINNESFATTFTVTLFSRRDILQSYTEYIENGERKEIVFEAGVRDNAPIRIEVQDDVGNTRELTR
jgi:hypothetical protein